MAESLLVSLLPFNDLGILQPYISRLTPIEFSLLTTNNPHRTREELLAALNPRPHLTMFLHYVLGFAVAGVASNVHAAPTTARSPASFVPGKVFDRIAIIWLENTDYSKAVGDR